MRPRWQAWHLALLVVVVCAGVAGFLFWSRSRSVPPLAERLRRLPPAALTAYVDLAALRQGGLLDLLAGQQVSEEEDYKRFVAASGFDYRTDLDSVLLARQGADVYILATGRFDWKQIRELTVQNGGACRNGMCRVAASQPKRFLSFIPLASGMIAMAVSTDEWRVAAMQTPSQPATLPTPDSPLWIAVPGNAFGKIDPLPPGTKLFATALGDARLVTFGIQPAGQRFEARLLAETASEATAQGLLNQLRGVTDVFRKYLERVNQQPGEAELSRILISGEFDRSGPVVTGRWPIERAFLESLAAGRL